MVMDVLQTKSQIDIARKELINKGASIVSSPLAAFLRRIGMAGGVTVGDHVKSWDVLSTINFLESHVQKNEPILDIGCYASEVIIALHQLGYSNLVGADLNPDLHKMPYKDVIRYEVVDFMQTKFEDASFRAITSISVIEHGFDGESLLKETSRLLEAGGYFIASFDYWPDKIDTTGTTFFGMDWKIFSKADVADFVKSASAFDLFPVGEMMCDGKERTIDCGGKQYTFAWMVLKKAD